MWSSTFTHGKLQYHASINCTPHTPPAQPGCSTQCRLHHSCSTLQKLHLTLQGPMIYQGLAIHTLAGLCALWLPSGAHYISGKLQYPVKPQRPQTTCPAWLQHPMQAPPHLLHTAEAAYDPAVAHGMPRAGHSHTGRALCGVVAKRYLYIWHTPAFSKTAAPINHLPSPAAPLSAGSVVAAAHCRGCI